MAITFGSIGATYTGSGTSHAVAYPSGIAAGSLLVLAVAAKDEPVTNPANWTSVGNPGGVGQASGLLAIKVATGSESGTLAVTTGDADVHAVIARYEGVDTTTPQDFTGTVTTGTGTTITFTGGTATTDGVVVVTASGGPETARTVDSYGGGSGTVVERVDTGGTASLTLYDEISVNSGATGNRTHGLSASTAYWGVLLALRPAGGGGGGGGGDLGPGTGVAGSRCIPWRLSEGTKAESAATVANPTNLAPGLPSPRSLGDVLLCYTTCRSATPTVATPAGWTSLFNLTGTNGRMALFARIVDGTETAPTVTWSGTTTTTACLAQIACFRGIEMVAGVPQIDVTGAVSNQAASTTAAAGGAAITTTTLNSLVLVFSTRLDDVGTWAVLGASDTVTWAKGLTTMTTTSGSDMAGEFQWGVRAAAGSIAAKTFTLTGGSSFASSGVMIALKAALYIQKPTTRMGAVQRAANW